MTLREDLDGVVADILVDAHGDDEHYAAFLTVCEEVCELPTGATRLGSPVTVTGLEQRGARDPVATCQGPRGTGEVTLADLAFPPDTLAAWIHAAYRAHLGLAPFPARPRPDWRWGT